MSLTIRADVVQDTVHVALQGALREIDPLVERRGKLDVLVDLSGFEGASVHALRSAIRIDPKGLDRIRRLAIVSDSLWDRGKALLCKPFVDASVRFFARHRRAEAEAWLREE